MILDAKNIGELWELIETQPHKFIRLCTGRTEITGFNSAKMSRQEHFETNMKPFLCSPKTPGGKYRIEGKTSTKATPYTMAEFQKGPDQPEAPATPAPPIRETPTFKMLEENADLKYKAKYLEEENERLKADLMAAQSEIEELNQTIEDMEKEAEEMEKTKPMLSDNQQAFLQLAGPLIPALQQIAVGYLSKYIPQEPQAPAEPNHNQNTIPV